MKKFIVVQTQIDSENVVGSEKNIFMSNIVRQVEADSEEEAIGRFVLATKDIKAFKKLDIECYDLSRLASV